MLPIDIYRIEPSKEKLNLEELIEANCIKDNKIVRILLFISFYYHNMLAIYIVNMYSNKILYTKEELEILKLIFSNYIVYSNNLFKKIKSISSVILVIILVMFIYSIYTLPYNSIVYYLVYNNHIDYYGNILFSIEFVSLVYLICNYYMGIVLNRYIEYNEILYQYVFKHSYIETR